MKKLHLILLFTLVAFAASAQKVYFVYIQAESEQPFFVKLNKKTMQSSGTGYLIIPKLVDSTYTFSIGSSQNNFPEQLFKVSIDKKDHGVLLKNFEGKGWGLYNLQTLDVLMAINTNENPGSGNTTASPFTEILAKATGDPSLKEKPVQPKKEEVKAEVVQETVKEETPVAEKVVNPGPVVVASEEEGLSKKERRKKQKEAEKAEAELLEKTESKKTGSKDETKPVEIKEAVVPVEEKKDTVAEVKEEANPESKDEKKENSPEVKAEEKPGKKEPVVVAEEKKAIQPEVKTDNIPVTNDVPEEKTVATINSEVKAEEKYKPSEVKKYAESSTTEGFGLVLIDKYDNAKRDTIRLVIPNPKPAVVKLAAEPKEEKKFLEISTEPGKNTDHETGKNNDVATAAVEPEKKTKKDKKAKTETEKTEPVKAEPVKTEPVNTKTEPSNEITEPVQKEKVVEVKESETEKEVTPATNPVAYKTNCPDLATDEEFVKLRKRMAGEKEDRMLGEARKYFKTKCFSTSQLRTLGRLFETDEERYNFFDAAYKHVSNPEAYPALVSEFQDSYYTNRFKAMLR